MIIMRNIILLFCIAFPHIFAGHLGLTMINVPIFVYFFFFILQLGSNEDEYEFEDPSLGNFGAASDGFLFFMLFLLCCHRLILRMR